MIEANIEDDMTAPLARDWITHIYALVPRPLLALQDAKRAFLAETQEEYQRAVKKAVLDYVLLDEKEQLRLGLPLPDKVNVSHEKVYRFLTCTTTFGYMIT